MKLLIMSDIHGNLNAIKSVERELQNYRIDACALLGDLIDYGMHSNEVIGEIKNLPYPLVCNIYGNHEAAVMNDEYERFSSERGRQCAKYTKSMLSSSSVKLIQSMNGAGKAEFIFDGKKFLAVHGSLKDVFWKSVDTDGDFSAYAEYDYVLSGHSHLPHFFEKYFHSDDAKKRNKKKTVFINPGSVGQPRNLNSFAQFSILDTETEEIILKKVLYDVEEEQRAYCGQVDEFYKLRLTEGV